MCITCVCFVSELKRRMKADKKAAEKEAKVKEQQEQTKDANDTEDKNAFGADEETLDPNVSSNDVLVFPQGSSTKRAC